MGSAIVRGAIRTGVLKPAEIIIAEIDTSKRAALQNTGCAVTDDARIAAQAEHIMLAVKPQVFSDVARSIGPLPMGRIVVSIMAGLNSERIRSALGGKVRVVRAMPNTPSQVAAGMTGIALGSGAKPGDEQLAVSLFNAIGTTVMVEESQMYAVTAVSASGPAYVFLLAEAMEKAAIELGIDEVTAHTLVKQTVMGAGRLLADSSQSAEQLRQAVTSPRGTTAAAVEVFQQERFAETVVRALTAARDRGRELDHA